MKDIILAHRNIVLTHGDIYLHGNSKKKIGNGMKPNNLIKIESPIDALISIKEGIYSEITITLWDQENRPLVFIDTEMTLFLIIQTD